MDEKEINSEKIQGLDKNKTIKIALELFFGILIFIVLIMLVFAGKIFWGPLLLIAGMEIILLVIMVFIAYAIAKKNPKLAATSESKSGQKKWSIFVILFGIYLIGSGIYGYLTGSNDTNQLKYVLIRVGFGIFTIIWAIYYLRKNKTAS